MEQELEILEIESKGNVYKNLNLKTKVDRATGGVIPGLTVGNYIIVEKVFPEGYENVRKYKNADGTEKEVRSFSCKVIYKGEEASFWLNEQEHNKFASIGGSGDDIKIIMTQADYKFKGETKKKLVADFDLVE